MYTYRYYMCAIILRDFLVKSIPICLYTCNIIGHDTLNIP